ncbi:MAG: 2-oxo acid dehydrogenase subunit E2 [Trueperaceae bacterium]|nr:2-oxo acid dehydrogenase subunit E2 [Trueperaceae bacterium]
MASPVLMPKQGNSVESCLIVEWKKRPGDRVEQGEILLEVETDKAVIEVESPASGTLLEIFYKENDDVPVQTTIAMIGEAGEQVEKVSEAKSEPSQRMEQTSQSVSAAKEPVPVSRSSLKIGVSPRARKLAEKENLDTSSLRGSGPQGRIIERDVLAALESRLADLPAATLEPNVSLIDSLTDDLVTVIPLTGIRKRIAKRMLESLQTTAQLTLNSSADARELLHYRAQLKKSPEALGARDISINDLMLFAISRALLQHPDLNAIFENDTIYQYKAVNLGFAVDTSRGLLVPVIHGAQDLSLKALSKKTKVLASQAQDGKIAPDDLQGASFTVTNLGAFGIDTFTPVLNPPQVAILGVGGINLKAVMVEGQVEHIPHISLSLTINHQVVDGAPGARFLQTLSNHLANLSNLFFL